MKQFNLKNTLSLAILFVMVISLTACGGSDAGTAAEGKDKTGPMADTNADNSPGVNELNATGAVSMPEEVKQKATGFWVQTQSGETYASLEFKYNSGADSDFSLSSPDGKNKIKGKATGHDDGTFVYSDCGLTLTFDGNNFTVSMDSPDCGGSKMDFNGVYSRK